MIKIDNRLPAGIKVEIYIEPHEVAKQLGETGFGEMAQKFMSGLFAGAKEDPLSTWIQWEGYWLDEPEDAHQTLLVLGVLYFKGRFWVRAMVSRHVPEIQLGAARAGLFAMIEQYLDKLRQEREQEQSN
jgi:hypothetical protein